MQENNGHHQNSNGLSVPPIDTMTCIRSHRPETARNKKPSITKRNNNDVQLPPNANKRNLFVKLSLFFNEPEYNQHVIEQLLEDQLQRGLTDVDTIVCDLEEYCSHFHRVPNNNCRSFMYAAFKVVTWCHGCAESGKHPREVKDRVDYLLQHNAAALRTLLNLICKPEFAALAIFMDVFSSAFIPAENSTPEKSAVALGCLDILLNACMHLHIEHKPGANFVDMVQGFGETPLIAATRARRDDTIALLVKYGANTQAKWLSFDNCLEVLLFSPHKINVNEKQITAIHSCLKQVLRGTKNINLACLREKSKEYHPIIPNWEDVVSTHACIVGPSPLSHLCRCAVRESLDTNWSLPNGVNHLPLPVPLKKYVDLTVL